MRRAITYVIGIIVIIVGLFLSYDLYGYPKFVGTVLKPLGLDANINQPNPYQAKPVQAAPAFTDRSLVILPTLPERPASLKVELIDALRNREFAELNSRIDAWHQASRPNSGARMNLFAAGFAFQIDDESLEPLLKEWIRATPDAYQPYFARASYYQKQAWAARGGEWAHETSDKQFSRMRRHLINSQEDLDTALRLNDRVLELHRLTLLNAHLFGLDKHVDRVLVKGLAVEPADYFIRSLHMTYLQPKWGGSYEEMAKFAETSLQYTHKNPKLKAFAGAVDAVKAETLRRNKEYVEAEKLFTGALDYGGDHAVFHFRGFNRTKLKDYAGALQDYNSALAIYPERAKTYYRRAFVHAKLQNFGDAIADIRHSLRLDPTDDPAIKFLDWLRKHLIYEGDQLDKQHAYKKALPYFNALVLHQPDLAEAYRRRARALVQMNQFELAEEDLKKSISLDPEDFYSFELYHWLLAREGREIEMIPYWGHYIVAKPADSKAYVQRGAIYYRKGDYRPALRDARIAADMGNQDGIDAYKKYQHLAQ
jgi:tetratricopeptide (TPR) repeat protein